MPIQESITDRMRDLKHVFTSRNDKEVFKEREDRLKELKLREKLLVVQARSTLLPILKKLNRAYYSGTGKIKVTPLSEDPYHGGTLRYAHAYEPFLLNKGSVRAEIRVELFKSGENTPSCYLRLWEKNKKGKQDLQAYFTNMPSRVKTYTPFMGFMRASTIESGDDWQMFDFSKQESLEEVRSYVATSAIHSPFFGSSINKS